jgi:hypothetical protein
MVGRRPPPSTEASTIGVGGLCASMEWWMATWGRTVLAARQGSVAGMACQAVVRMARGSCNTGIVVVGEAEKKGGFGHGRRVERRGGAERQSLSHVRPNGR